jgi:PPK2 family polyphosphate:nucleotide phosphotransferase
MATSEKTLSAALRLSAGTVDLSEHDARATPHFDGGKKDGKKALAELGDPLADLQERLFAEGVSGGRRSVLLVLQGMDTSGKGGIVRHAAGLVDPQGLSIKSFKAPTSEELAHDFLWRITRALPAAGQIGIFDRSHYEDVLIARVHGLVGEDLLESRYEAINDFERRLVDEGTVVVKCFLHISAAKQEERLLERLDDPHKHWKFNPGDVDERALWPAYQKAYALALERTHTEAAPWHVVPADKKWYRNLAVGTLLHDALRGLDPQWPAADYDVAEQRARLENAPDGIERPAAAPEAVSGA